MTKAVAMTALIALTIAAFSASSSVLAQYPQPPGSIVSTVGDSTPEIGETVTLVCDAVDTDGNPLEGAECTYTIISEPGNDAALGSKTVTKTTNSAGQAFADLFVGTTPGTLVVVMTSGNTSSTVVLEVVTEEQAPAPPAAPIDVDDDAITPPSTGDAGLAG